MKQFTSSIIELASAFLKLVSFLPKHVWELLTFWHFMRRRSLDPSNNNKFRFLIGYQYVHLTKPQIIGKLGVYQLPKNPWNYELHVPIEVNYANTFTLLESKFKLQPIEPPINSIDLARESMRQENDLQVPTTLLDVMSVFIKVFEEAYEEAWKNSAPNMSEEEKRDIVFGRAIDAWDGFLYELEWNFSQFVAQNVVTAAVDVAEDTDNYYFSPALSPAVKKALVTRKYVTPQLMGAAIETRNKHLSDLKHHLRKHAHTKYDEIYPIAEAIKNAISDFQQTYPDDWAKKLHAKYPGLDIDLIEKMGTRKKGDTAATPHLIAAEAVRRFLEVDISHRRVLEIVQGSRRKADADSPAK